jgi:lysophospholipase
MYSLLRYLINVQLTHQSNYQTSQNRTTFFPSSYSFPPVPTSQSSFKPLLAHPTFFGCSSEAPTPLLIYIPNSAPRSGATPATNTTFLQLAYPQDEIRLMLDQTFDIATQGIQVDGGDDKEWPACLACAVVDRSRVKLGYKRSGVCKSCFERYCWGGQ